MPAVVVQVVIIKAPSAVLEKVRSLQSFLLALLASKALLQAREHFWVLLDLDFNLFISSLKCLKSLASDLENVTL